MLTMLRVTAIAQIVQGCLELVMAALLALGAVLQGSPEFQERLADNPMARMMPGFFGVLALLFAVLGGLRIYAGVRAWKFEGYVLSLVTAFAGLLTLLSCYCAPTAVLVLVLVLVTLLNGQVREAFDRRRGGARPSAVEDWLRSLESRP